MSKEIFSHDVTIDSKVYTCKGYSHNVDNDKIKEGMYYSRTLKAVVDINGMKLPAKAVFANEAFGFERNIQNGYIPLHKKVTLLTAKERQDCLPLILPPYLLRIIEGRQTPKNNEGKKSVGITKEQARNMLKAHSIKYTDENLIEKGQKLLDKAILKMMNEKQK